MEDEIYRKSYGMTYNSNLESNGNIILSNIFSYYDEENDVYCISDSLILDDGEIRVEVSFLLDSNYKPLGLVYNSYFADQYDSLDSALPVNEAYDKYKDELVDKIRKDMNNKYDKYISINKKYLSLNRKRKNDE